MIEKLKIKFFIFDLFFVNYTSYILILVVSQFPGFYLFLLQPPPQIKTNLKEKTEKQTKQGNKIKQ